MPMVDSLDKIRVMYGIMPDWLAPLLLRAFGQGRGDGFYTARLHFPSVTVWLERYGRLDVGGEQTFVARPQERSDAWQWDAGTVEEFARVVGCRYQVEDYGRRDGALQRLVSLFGPTSHRGLEPGPVEGPPWLCAELTNDLPPWFTQRVIETFPVGRPNHRQSIDDLLAARYPRLFKVGTEVRSLQGLNPANSRPYEWDWRGLKGLNRPILITQRDRDGAGFLQPRDFNAAELQDIEQLTKQLGIHFLSVRRPLNASGVPVRIKTLQGVVLAPVPIV